MEFDGAIHKITVAARKEGEFESHYVMLQIMIPFRPGESLSHFAGYFRQAARFTVEKQQLNMDMKAPQAE